MTQEQFIKIVSYALKAHVSRDATVCDEDRGWEDENAARTIASMLRVAMPGNDAIPNIETRAAV